MLVLHTNRPHKQTRAPSDKQLSGYYGLSLFNSCSLNAPDNDKAAPSLTASLLTLSLLSPPASHSQPLHHALCLLCHTQGRFDGFPSHHLNVPIHLQLKPARRRNANSECRENNLQKPWHVSYHLPLTGNITVAALRRQGWWHHDIRCHNLTSLCRAFEAHQSVWPFFRTQASRIFWAGISPDSLSPALAVIFTLSKSGNSLHDKIYSVYNSENIHTENRVKFTRNMLEDCLKSPQGLDKW